MAKKSYLCPVNRWRLQGVILNHSLQPPPVQKVNSKASPVQNNQTGRL
ncbi:hypothetical protein [Capnocytophaga canis]|nr:hypothetical protein [Capnocytophaga canis]